MMDRTLIKRALPIAVVLTICATGSEMNSGGVITNESTQEKLEINSPLLYPRLSICDPTYLYTLPPKQTAAGSVDILSHAMEQYFQPNDEAYITDVLTEGVMKTVIKYAPIAMKIPDNYEARSNLMWASTVGLNHLLTVGKGGAWSVHMIEHVVSAFYDLTHGVGLAILTPAWMRYVLSDDNKKRFARFAREVFGVTVQDDMTAALMGIDCVEQFMMLKRFWKCASSSYTLFSQALKSRLKLYFPLKILQYSQNIDKIKKYDIFTSRSKGVSSYW